MGSINSRGAPISPIVTSPRNCFALVLANPDFVATNVIVRRIVAGSRPTVAPCSSSTPTLCRRTSIGRDIASLSDHASFLNNKINFLLDATLGMINIEQNAIIKIFSVAAVVFLPPTLIASIYGMNFTSMPELDSAFGYPMALALMVISAILPYWYFKRRGWL